MNYNTEQRKLIEEYIMTNQEKFVNVEEIKKYMEKNNRKVGTTTIYRYLNNLEQEEKIRTEIKEHTKYCQYISNECSNHFHLKCKKCGETIHLDCKDFEEVNEHIQKEHKFKLDHNTIIYGLCEKCEEAK